MRLKYLISVLVSYMTDLNFTLLILIFAYLAGLLGALTGLGGGVIIIPVLVLLFHVNIHYAMGAALISVIATSSGAAAAFLREGYINIRIGMFLEVGAAIGALLGAALLVYLPVNIVTIIFASVLLFSAYFTVRRREEHEVSGKSDPIAQKLKLEDSYPTPKGPKSYSVHRVPTAFGLMTLAGILSGLLGIGSGVVKVLAMDQAMRLPYKVATTTSNFIIGITAAVGAGVYFSQGYIDPVLTFPVMIGVLIGAITGARLLSRAPVKLLRWIFGVVIGLIALQMLYKAFTGAM